MRVRRLPIGDVLELRREPVAIQADREYRQIGVRGFGRGIFDYPVVPGSELGKLRFFRVAPDRLIVSNIKGWEGAVGVTSNHERGRIASSRFLQYAASEDVHLAYLAHWLLSESGLAALGRASPGSADRNRTLSITGFEAIEVPLPDIEEQRRICAGLERLGAIATRSAQAHQHRNAVLGQMRDWSWPGERVRVGNLVQPITRPRPVHPEIVYRMQGVRWYGGGLFTREVKYGRELSARTVYDIEPGDLVYNRLFAWKQSFALADPHVTGSVSNEFPTFRIDADRVRPRVLLALLLGQDFTRQVLDASTGSTPTSRNRLKEVDFMNLEVVMPRHDDQPAIERVLRTCDEITAISATTQRLADALLPAARNEIFSAMR